ncbi:primosomal protein N' [Trichothermofontia sp.]
MPTPQHPANLKSKIPKSQIPSVGAADPPAIYAWPNPGMGWAEVLVDCPGAAGLFTYEVPPDLGVQPGDIVSVPFGSQQVGAIAVRLLSHLPADLAPAQVRPITEVIARGFFSPTYWELLQRVAAYYYTPLIQVIRTALPPGLLGRAQRRIRLTPALCQRLVRRSLPDAPLADLLAHSLPLSPPATQLLEHLRAAKTHDYSWQHLRRQVRGADRGLRELLARGWVESYLEPPRHTRPKVQQAVTLVADPSAELDVTPKQQHVLMELRRHGGDLWLRELLQICGVQSSVVKTLASKGYVVLQSREVLRASPHAVASDRPQTLTPAQAEAVAVIGRLTGHAQVLLHGVTGSGKTEVYLQAIAPLLAQGKSALVLVPEIGLTPQLTDRFRARFGSQVCVYHSALGDGERYDTWRQLLSGPPQVVIGTRSAVFLPLSPLGLIILDEEHDSSFKQDAPAPCYHARTVAQWRSHLENCPLLLGSATPSLETWCAVQSPPPQATCPYHYLSLPDRIQARPMPAIEVIDMRQELAAGNRSIFSRALQAALQTLQDQKQQGILFIHRRGHSTFVSCRSCGTVIDCPNCDVSLAYHHPHAHAQPLLRCHYCNYTRSQPSQCPTCGSPYLKHFGSGTQRVMQELASLFPDLRALRFDSDTTRTKGAHRTLLTQFATGGADLLIGTQMLTKGIDLPQVTLVGVVAADGLLYLSDFRASERAMQTLTQVAGRAGRGEELGRVLLQTYTPLHPVVRSVQQHTFTEFLAAELRQRAQLHYPPQGQLILLRLSSPDLESVQAAAEALARLLTPDDHDAAGYDVLGPAPAQVMRVARRYRWQILLKVNRDRSPRFPLPLPDLRQYCPANVSLTIDVDPLNLL